MRSFRRAERQVTDRVLCELALDESYRRHLLGVLDRWAAPGAGGAALADLPYLSCEACGGDPDQVVPIGAAWSLTRLSAKLFDDVEDAEVTIVVPQTINAALGLVLAAQRLLLTVDADGGRGDRVADVARRFTEACLLACGGQHADVSVASAVEDLDPDRWLEIARAKSGAFYGWASWVGAVLAGADDAVAQRLWSYGVELGVLLQIADDYDGVWCPEGPSDLITGRPSLPLAYAYTAASELQRLHLSRGLSQARLGSLEQERAVRADIESMGAQAFMLVAGRASVASALGALDAAALPKDLTEGLHRLVADVFPVLARAELGVAGP